MKLPGSVPSGLLAAILLCLGFVADNALVSQSAGLESKAIAEADETARMAALSVRATLAELELSVVAGHPPPGSTMARLALATWPSLSAGSPRAYGLRSRDELSRLLNSSATNGDGLPEAVLAAVALGSPDGRREVADRLLAGRLPVRVEDLSHLANALGAGDDPRVEGLKARLRRSPSSVDLPAVPTFMRTITARRTLAGWSRRDKTGIGYEIPLSQLLDESGVSDRARLAHDGDREEADRMRPRVAAVPGVPGLALAVGPERTGRENLRVLRVLLWLAVFTSLISLGALHRALHREQQAIGREKTFLANVTHELRTPLAAIRLFGDTLAEGRGDACEYGALVAQESERLEALVDRILAVTRIDEAPAFARVEPGRLLSSAVELITARARRRAVTVEWQAPANDASLPVAIWDGDAVRHALLNLLDNAIKHGKHGGRVALKAEAQGQFLRLCVTDDGPGIFKADRKRVFGRFERGKTSAPGTGLGLYVVEEVARAHGGRVDLTSERNQGCTVTLVLPLLPPGVARETGRVEA